MKPAVVVLGLLALVVAFTPQAPAALATRHNPDPAATESEPNDSAASADPVTVGATMSGYTDSDGGDDWWNFTIPSTAYEIHVDLEFVSYYTQCDLKLYHESNLAIPVASDTYSPELSIHYDPTQNGTYYIEVEQDGTSMASYSGGVYYSLDTPSGDAGNSRESATTAPSTTGTAITGRLSPSDDDDWYKFTVSEGEKISTTLSEGSGVDVDFYLVDPGGDTRDSDTYGGGTLSYTARETGTWYVWLERDDGHGSYTLTISISPGQSDDPFGNLWVLIVISIVVVAGIAATAFTISQQRASKSKTAGKIKSYVQKAKTAPPKAVTPRKQARGKGKEKVEPRFCPFCGSKLEETTGTCPACGTEVGESRL